MCSSQDIEILLLCVHVCVHRVCVFFGVFFVCVCTLVCVCMHSCVCVCACMHSCVCVCVCALVCVCVYALYVYALVCVCVCMCVCVCAYVCVYALVCVCKHWQPLCMYFLAQVACIWFCCHHLFQAASHLSTSAKRSITINIPEERKKRRKTWSLMAMSSSQDKINGF